MVVFLYSHASNSNAILYLISSLTERVESLENRLVCAEARDIATAKYIKLLEHEIKIMKPMRKCTVTAYSPRPKETDSTPHITASNKKVRAGIIAVSRDLYDLGWVFGRKVYIEGMGIFVIEDLMASRKRSQVDIFMWKTNDALKFGRQKRKVYLLDT